jgi:hypothetical protein
MAEEEVGSSPSPAVARESLSLPKPLTNLHTCEDCGELGMKRPRACSLMT